MTYREPDDLDNDIDEDDLDDNVEPTEIYDNLVTEEPKREIDFDEFLVPKTIGEAEEEGVHKTDLQAAMTAITPRFATKRQNDILQPVMSSRIFPDNFLDVNYFINIYLLEEQEGDDAKYVDVLGTIINTQVATTIAYEGRHIIDVLEIAGVAHEEEMEKITRALDI